MNDVLNGHKSSVETIRPPAWANADTMAATAVRRTRRRRVVTRTVVGAVAAAVVVGGGVLTSSYDDGGGTTALPGAAAGLRSAAPPDASVPDGWSAQAFGGLTYGVPDGWIDTDWGSGPSISWRNEATTQHIDVEVGTIPGRTASEHDEVWDVPGARKTLVYHYEDKGTTSATIEVRRGDGIVYDLRVGAPASEALERLLDGLRGSLVADAEAVPAREILGSTDSLPVMERPEGLPGGWRTQEVEGLELGIPEGWSGNVTPPRDDAADASTDGAWFDDSGTREIWVTHWAGWRDVLASPDAASGYRTFELEGADYVAFSPLNEEPGDSELVMTVRRADGGGTYQIRVVAPLSEGTELASQVAGTLTLG